ncbi:discoidin domain-containing protein [Micromonospora sp. CB01531]|uniref:discoidin domain-containing protein n=1 Tax=Micromonospora sp. CB01531 TaxID=1718947 RepID=UPI00093B7763|nr:discoidin domain-containing protein [Micromonospora sp. CB01531]OKI85253.1 hypothetical protein A6A27_40175 [Micromonospora sp. CB01531]
MTAPGILTRLLDALARIFRPVTRSYLRLNATLRRVVAAGTAILVVAVGAVAVSQGMGVINGQNTPLVGRAVPAEQLAQIHAAALSCPALTPARLAGQIMAISEFNVNAKTSAGGVGIAGLTAPQWEQWSPWPDAQRPDPGANILALAHYMCDLLGQLRVSQVAGDAWRNALAATAAGVPAVVSARGVPGGAPARFVDAVVRYADWYALQPGFTPASPQAGVPLGAGVPSAGTPARPVPNGYLASVLAAGKVCPAITPPRVAAQLMASSGFNPNLLGANGAQGVAQFLPELWRQYSSSQLSPWDPTVAILMLGRAMCDQVAQLNGLGEDPYTLALTAFRWGPGEVRRAAGKTEPASMREFATAVLGYADYYARDARLGSASPSPSPSPSPSTLPSQAPATAAPTGKPRQPRSAPLSHPAPPAKPVVNLALHRKVVASSFQDTRFAPYQNFPAGLAVDGNGGTRWSSLAENPSWIYVDLGAVHNLVGVRLVWETAYSKNYEIRVSNDANNWTTVRQAPNGNGGVDQFTFSVNARYVKMYSITRGIDAYGVSLWEFEVLGR